MRHRRLHGNSRNDGEAECPLLVTTWALRNCGCLLGEKGSEKEPCRSWHVCARNDGERESCESTVEWGFAFVNKHFFFARLRRINSYRYKRFRPMRHCR